MAFLPTLKLAQFLSSAEGAYWLSYAATLPLTAQTLLADSQTLRHSLMPEQASVVVEQVLLRRQGRVKFERAEAMLLLRDALEQATHGQVSQHRAARFRGAGWVADLGCSIGGDTIHLAAVADHVLGIDLDRIRLEFAKHNSAVYKLAGKIALIRADMRYLPGLPSHFDAIFADPARRTSQGKRTFNPHHYRPPLDKLIETYAQQPLGIKVAPGIDFAAIPPDGEVEVISLAGEVKEAVLWFKELATPGVSRRATLLPGGETLTGATSAGCPIGALGAYLYEPDPAIIRAGLVTELAAVMNLTQLDPDIAYLTANERITSPYVKVHRIEAQLPLRIKPINRYLKQHQIGQVNVKQRGTGLSPDIVTRQLKVTKGGPERTLILMRIQDEHLALICERLL